MPREQHPEPFWRSARNCYYVQIGKRQIRLDEDRDEAWRLYHELMARPPEEPQVVTYGQQSRVVDVIDTFLEWAETNNSPKTFQWRKENLQTFAQSIPGNLTVADLKPFHVTREMNAHPNWGNDSRANFARCVQRAFRWAFDQGLVDKNPIYKVEKPQPQQREEFLTKEEYQDLLSRYPDQAFRDVIITVWETGCRPTELFMVAKRHVDSAGRRWVFPTKESKGKRKQRIVYLSDTAWAITERLMQTNPHGELFRNADGKPWDKRAVNCRFSRKKKAIGRKYSLYALRHSFCQRLLLEGKDILTVSLLMGHSTPAMVMRHYQHLQKNPEFLRKALNPISNADA
jgi:integrase